MLRPLSLGPRTVFTSTVFYSAHRPYPPDGPPMPSTRNQCRSGDLIGSSVPRKLDAGVHPDPAGAGRVPITVASMASPAQRYAAARHRSTYPLLTEFRGDFPFELDAFQLEGARSLERGASVLVCAPTGSGKTVVGAFAVHLALSQGRRCFYTAPIKALSNQKFRDLGQHFGVANVGLLTGDTVLNPDAPVLVMTTEVLRNMLYVGSSALTGLGFVVMDEVHFLGDRFRGAVWEEVIIHLPSSVQVAALSATVSNAEEFGEWLGTVRGDTDVIVHEHRPVPLWQHMLVGTRLFDLFAETSTSTIDPQLARHVNERMNRTLTTPYGRGRRDDRHRSGGSGGTRHWRPTPHPDVIDRLDRDGLLPAIVFIFSRAGCDAAVRQCVSAGMWLTDEAERETIRRTAEARTADLAADDLTALGYWEWLDGLQRGVAAHHAGLIPVFKETVEELFTAGLIRAVFATETLALGINMPARTVVIDRLRKFNGETHVDVTAGEYTQLTGRAGRRGIDIEGHAVVLWGPQTDPGHVAGLASTRTYPLRSSFRPSYNMAVNLIATTDYARAHEVLESSFAQFQADRSVVGVARQARSLENAIASEAEGMHCSRGDFGEYARLRRELKTAQTDTARSGRAQQRAAAAASLDSLKRGDVIDVPSGKRAGWAVVVDNPSSPTGETRPLVLTTQRWAGRLSVLDFPVPVEVSAQLRVPKHFDHRSPQARRDLASALRGLDLAPRAHRRAKTRQDGAGADEIARLGAAIRSHPCHGCPDQAQHARAAERIARLERELATTRDRMAGRTNTLARAFDRICAVLVARGLLVADADGRPERVTPTGRTLAGIWGESDLLTVECIRAGGWDGLNPADLAAAVSCLVYEARRDDESAGPLPSSALKSAVAAMSGTWTRLVETEAAHGVAQTREPHSGFATAAHRWASGSTLARALETPEGEARTAGDFVRWCRQVIDLLEQVARVADDATLAGTARQAASALRRGVVTS